MAIDLQLMRATAAALDAIYNLDSWSSAQPAEKLSATDGRSAVGKDAGRAEISTLISYSKYNAGSPPPPVRCDGEIWCDAQGELRFTFDGVAWSAGRGMMPPDVRAAFLQKEIENERTRF